MGEPNSGRLATMSHFNQTETSTPEPDEHELQIELTKLEATLLRDENNIPCMCRLSDIYRLLDKQAKSESLLKQAMETLSLLNPMSASMGYAVIECALRFWKAAKYVKDFRVNFSSERMEILGNINTLLDLLIPLKDPVLGEKFQFLKGYVLETAGQYQEALAIYSDLIAAQAMEMGVDLTFVIFRAAVILTHIGGFAQAIEYLEFLLDEPPAAEGYQKTHILGFLISVYERSGDRYQAILERSYDDLLDTYTKDMKQGKRPLTNQKKIEYMLSKKTMSQSSEIWEMLALQAIDRCEYVLAAEMMQQAVVKAPTKGKLLHILAEVYLYLNEKDRATKTAERAFTFVPNNADLRNLLLIVNREKWQDKLRSVGASKEELSKEEEERRLKAQGGIKLQKADDFGGDSQDGEHWISKLASKATKVAEATQKDGAMGFLGAITGTPEQRAKEAAAKERQRLIKAQRRAKREAEKAIADEAARKLNAAQARLKEQQERLGPSKPVKPPFSQVTVDILKKIREGNPNIVLYDPNLKALALVRSIVAKEEAAREEKKAKIAALQAKAGGRATPKGKGKRK